MRIFSSSLCLLGLMILPVATAVAQTQTVTVNSGGKSDTYTISTNGTSTTITKVDGGDPRLKGFEIDDPDEQHPVTIWPPVVLGPLDSTLNIWPYMGGTSGGAYPNKPKYPIELYMQLYPFMFSKP